MSAQPNPNQPRALGPDDRVPGYLRPLVATTMDHQPSQLWQRLSGRSAGTSIPVRESAVLLLLADDRGEPDLLLTRRADTLRHHPGQPAFPGGAVDPGETVVEAALREGWEETGLEPSSVLPLLLFPRLQLPVSSYAVTPVLAHWHRPGPVAPVDAAETAAVARVPLADLADPANRMQLRHHSGYVGPGFDVAGMRVWGFTAALVDVLLDLGGWARPWGRGRVLDLPDEKRSGPVTP